MTKVCICMIYSGTLANNLKIILPAAGEDNLQKMRNYSDLTPSPNVVVNTTEMSL